MSYVPKRDPWPGDLAFIPFDKETSSGLISVASEACGRGKACIIINAKWVPTSMWQLMVLCEGMLNYVLVETQNFKLRRNVWYYEEPKPKVDA
jgi:hypothetical protein